SRPRPGIERRRGRVFLWSDPLPCGPGCRYGSGGRRRMWRLAAVTVLVEAARHARWADLQHAIFGDKPVQDGGEVIDIETPQRAEDAAIVPLSVHVAD